MRLKSNPSPLDVLEDAMRWHHELARQKLDRLRLQGPNKTAEKERQDIEEAVSKALKLAADFAKNLLSILQSRARAEADEEIEVEINDFADRRPI
jgi:hypothetical protein